MYRHEDELALASWENYMLNEYLSEEDEISEDEKWAYEEEMYCDEIKGVEID